MSDDHRLDVFDEAPVDGKAANAAAWRGINYARDLGRPKSRATTTELVPLGPAFHG